MKFGWSDLKVCVIIDDASRMILAGGEFKNINIRNRMLIVDEFAERYWWLSPMRELILDRGAESVRIEFMMMAIGTANSSDNSESTK